MESGTPGLGFGSGRELEADCCGVSLFKATVFGCGVGLVTGGLGAGFLVSGVGGEDVARGETGGLFLALRAASLGECLRFGGIGVPDF